MTAWAVPAFAAEGAEPAQAKIVGENNNGRHDQRGNLQAVLYDLSTDKTTKIGLVGHIVVPTFDRTGKGLIVVAADWGGRSSKMYTTPADKIKLRQLSISGLPGNPCPGTDLLPLLLLPDREARRAATQPKVGFVLMDLAKDKVVGELPGPGMREPNAQWTGDGRYLYYIGMDGKPGPNRRRRPKYKARIWDRKKGRLAGDVPHVIPIGPGPTATTMVLAPSRALTASRPALGPGWIVHDQAADKRWKLSGPPLRPMNVQGKYILYVKKGKEGKEIVCRGRIQLPKATQR